MKRIRLTETELVNLIKNVINEQQGPPGPGGYAGGTPCYACINNQIETMLFPSSALGQPYPDCAPTAYGYQGQPNGLPGGASSYVYPSIWSEVQPTNCGGGTSPNSPSTLGRTFAVEKCDGSSHSNVQNWNLTVDGNTPQVGDTIDPNQYGSNWSGWGMGIDYGNENKIKVVAILANIASNQIIDFNSVGACSNTPPTGGCDPSAWSGYNTWISNWTNGGAFNSQNPKQPCNHICKQINTWTNKLTNVSTTQANQLNCKIDEGNNQSQIHGCDC